MNFTDQLGKLYTQKNIDIGLHDLWQADLIEYISYSSENKGYKYVLVVINCFSKKVWTVPLKTKSAKHVTEAMELVLHNNKSPKNLQTDFGNEFYNTSFRTLMKKNQVNHYSTYSITKASICERVIRTIKTRLEKLFALRGDHNWIDVLQDVTKKYNNSFHRTIGTKPNKVNKHNEKQILDTAYTKLKIVGKQKFHVGDIVRLSKYKKCFDKGYTMNWTPELFKVVKIRLTHPTTYLLESLDGVPILGCFYNEELLKTKNPDIYLIEKVLQRRNKMVKVKWLSFPEPTWIKASDLY